MKAGPATFTLLSEDYRKTSTVEIEARYVPVNIKLEPRESINSEKIYDRGQYERNTHQNSQTWAFCVLISSMAVKSVVSIAEVRIRTSYVVELKSNNVILRQIRPICCILAQRFKSLQVSDQEEDA